MRTTRTRHQFYLPDALSEKLDVLASKPGASKTAILTDALTAWIERAAHKELDERFGPRLDRQNRSAERTERKLEALTELVGVFVQHQLTLVAHQPPFDDETGRLGRDRYARLIDLVERRMTGGGIVARLAGATEKTND
ncbi:CopG family transcriptional regulator [Sphingomonas koreensis]|jgi:predicted DNA-binding protein|uniref:CopG family transcriptional regulator n=1 Tax=Sphingomonas koreensis TaxID=93064 RepID=UPI00234EDD47|nr:CopG family transcriptional regulator [Sphingomonas koreensis]MDC7812370.1 CopG family transcriptional regulator [Sphingomonas koreensis]